MSRRLLRGWGLATLAIGILLTVLAAALVDRSGQRALEVELASQGRTFVATLEDIATAAVFEAEGVAAFYEASDQVSSLEFERFARRALADPVSRIEYAQVVGSRFQRSPYELGGKEGQRIIVSETAGEPGIGMEPGDDVLDLPDRAALVEETAMTGEPAMSTFIEIEGDDEPGDVLVVTGERDSEGHVWGVVMATIQLNEILEHQLQEARTDTLWELTPTEPSTASGPDFWSGEVSLSDEMWLQGTRAPYGHSGAFWVVVIGGVMLTLAAAWIIESMRAERHAKEESEALRKAAADKDQFLAGVGHQLRTPLTGVVGMLDLLANGDDSLGPEERLEFLGTARSEAHKLAELVDRFVIAGRIRVETLTVLEEVVGLRDLLGEAMQRVERPDHVDITVTGDVPDCMGDPLRIRQVLHGLIENAARHARANVEVSFAIEEEKVVVKVSNDGARLSDKEAETAFNPFTSAPEAGQPTRIGIGLWIARELAQRMGGSLQYESEDSTTFVLRLRRVPAASTVNEPDGGRRRSVRASASASRGQTMVVTAVQPIVDLKAGTIAGYEALTRGVRGETWWDLQSRIETMTLHEMAITSALQLNERRPPNTFLTINIDSPLLAHPTILRCLDRAGDLSGVIIELTEHHAVLESDAIDVLERVRAAGALIALDDFGAGHNGLARLLAIRPQFVKLDGRLIDRLETDPSARAVLDTVGDLASRIDAWVVAEKVETTSQLKILAEHHVPLAQGYLFGRPEPPWPDVNEAARPALDAIAGSYDVDGSVGALAQPVGSGSDGRRILMDASGRILALQDGEKLIDRPLVVQESEASSVALKRALTRSKSNVYDPMVVVDATGAPVGYLTVERLAADVADKPSVKTR